eukprot:1825574-Prorocentrum_lima.AAC.1
MWHKKEEGEVVELWWNKTGCSHPSKSLQKLSLDDKQLEDLQFPRPTMRMHYGERSPAAIAH